MTTQTTSIPSIEQKSFIANYLLMLRSCEVAAERDRDIILKRWVEGGFRIWYRMTGQKIDPKWVKTEPGQSCSGPNLEKIAKKEQADALHMYWLLMTSCDNDADNNDDAELKPKVVEWYEQWNRITGAHNEPGWVTRAKQKEKIE